MHMQQIPSLGIIFLIQSTTCGRPSKVDVGFIVDVSSYMTKEDIRSAYEMIGKLANHLSISSGTTRFAIITVNNRRVERQFLFKDIVNRECLMREIGEISGRVTSDLVRNKKHGDAKYFQKSYFEKSCLAKVRSFLCP